MVTGWGATIENGTMSPQLRAVNVTLFNKTLCRLLFYEFAELLNSQVFCAGKLT